MRRVQSPEAERSWISATPCLAFLRRGPWRLQPVRSSCEPTSGQPTRPTPAPRPGALALLAGLLVALAGAGCHDGLPCRSKTLYLYLHVAQSATNPWSEAVALADRIQVRVQVATQNIQGAFNRAPSENDLVVEVNFVDGYPQGQMAEVSVTAYTGQQALATEVLPAFPLEPGCTSARVALGECDGGTLCGMALGGLGCVDITSDNENCGACGRNCAYPKTCQQGQCQ